MNGKVAAAILIGGPLAIFFAVVCSFSNNPYPDEPTGLKIYYSSFSEPPKHLDPQVNYSTDGSRYLGAIYDTLLDYDYLKRPYELVPSLAQAVPKAESFPIPAEKKGNPPVDGVKYSINLFDGVLFQRDDCFPGPGGTREMIAKDAEFTFKRIADPEVECPVLEKFAKIWGMEAFQNRLAAVRTEEASRLAKDPKAVPTPLHLLYEKAGPIDGIRLRGAHGLDLILQEPYPQILYWLAMPFATPVPWEAVERYDGKAGRESFNDHPVGTGPFRLALYDKDAKIVLERNPLWRGAIHPERKYPGTTYPTVGEPRDREEKLVEPEYAGKPVPFVDRIEFRYEFEAIPRFGKFMQGYYDASGIIKESFDKVVQNQALTPEVKDKGIRLIRSVGLDVSYMGFNMEDDVVGAPALFKDPEKQRDRERWLLRNRRLRQAMSLAYDAKEESHIFANDRGIAAQSPLPPGIYGYEESYRNPYRQYDPSLARAKALLAEAGYPGGVDPKTKRPLEMTFDAEASSPEDFLFYEFATRAWEKLGLKVRVDATDYNQFQEKMKKGSFQIFRWGWVADYPDPENFLFLLYGPMGRTHGNGPNTANFANERYDLLFQKMEALQNDESAEWEEKDPKSGAARKVRRSRLEIIREMRSIAEEECPWILVSHSEDYGLYPKWLKNVKPYDFGGSSLKYFDVDPALRAVRRRESNRPNRGPAWILLAAAALLVLPGVRIYLRERT